jgi:hypothetical protein
MRHQNRKNHRQYTASSSSTEEITIIEGQTEIVVSFVKIVDLLGVLVTIKKNNRTVSTNLFKESDSLINKEASYFIYEGRYQVVVKFYTSDGKFYNSVLIRRDHSRVTLQIIEK